MAIEVSGKASLGIFGGSAGCDVFKKIYNLYLLFSLWLFMQR
jgi:hypothetical protein